MDVDTWAVISPDKPKDLAIAMDYAGVLLMSECKLSMPTHTPESICSVPEYHYLMYVPGVVIHAVSGP